VCNSFGELCEFPTILRGNCSGESAETQSR
jgi:hypothetical protein